jgi:hypothetical protein
MMISLLNPTIIFDESFVTINYKFYINQIQIQQVHRIPMFKLIENHR